LRYWVEGLELEDYVEHGIREWQTGQLMQAERMVTDLGSPIPAHLDEFEYFNDYLISHDIKKMLVDFLRLREVMPNLHILREVMPNLHIELGGAHDYSH